MHSEMRSAEGEADSCNNSCFRFKIIHFRFLPTDLASTVVLLECKCNCTTDVREKTYPRTSVALPLCTLRLALQRFYLIRCGIRRAGNHSELGVGSEQSPAYIGGANFVMHA
jgi:hypothetical protein